VVTDSVSASNVESKYTSRGIDYNTVMIRKRLTREESRELTAQRLVEAAKRLIARRGSRGAFYSNFKSKNELFYEVLRQDQLLIDNEFNVAFDDAATLEEIRGRLREVYTRLYDSPDRFMIWTEARMLSVRDAKFRAKFEAVIVERRDFMVKLIGYLCRRMGAQATVPLETLAMGFISLMEGVRLFGASCPNALPPEIGHSILDIFVESVLKHAMQPIPSQSAARQLARSASASP
jgi:AcrR family transcriptional regulator